MRHTEEIVIVPVGVQGVLDVPPDARGLVLFAHGSGSGRLSPRNRQVAEALVEAGFATLLMDLLTEEEAADRSKVFDIALLAQRLEQAARWAHDHDATAALPQGYFGASTGAGAALVAAAHRPDATVAVVARGGRPDLAGEALDSVRAPVLLIVGSLDSTVLALNEAARRHLRGESELAVVAGATHLFEEPGTLEEVTRLAVQWFDRFMPEPL